MRTLEFVCLFILNIFILFILLGTSHALCDFYSHVCFDSLSLLSAAFSIVLICFCFNL